MYKRFVGLVLCALVAAACQEATNGIASPSGPNALPGAAATGSGSSAATAGNSRTSSMVAERPWKATLTWTVTGLQFANPEQPFDGTTSLFGGRCSVPSDYVISGSFEGVATHAGSLTGSASHCSQLIWTPQGPAGATYSDGGGSLLTANGSTLALRYGSGTSGYDVQAGENWYEDSWVFDGGTGLFAGATGSGTEGGRFKDFGALLSGVPAAMWMEGSITHNPSGK